MYSGKSGDAGLYWVPKWRQPHGISSDAEVQSVQWEIRLWDPTSPWAVVPSNVAKGIKANPKACAILTNGLHRRYLVEPVREHRLHVLGTDAVNTLKERGSELP